MKSDGFVPLVVIAILIVTTAAGAAQAGANSHVAEINGIRMHYEDVGEGDVLLLLHSGTQTSRMWDDFVPRFSRNHRLIIPDLRGHGGSTNPDGLWTTRQFAADVFALLDTLEIGRFEAMGASIGGMTLLRMAALQPERIGAMVVIGVGTEIPPECREILASVTTDTMTEESRQRLRELHHHGDQQIRDLYAWVATLGENGRDTSFSPDLLATVTAPTLVIHGDSDYCFPASMAWDISEAIPDSALWVVPNGSHVPIADANAGAFADIVLGFLSAAGPESPPQSDYDEVKRVIEFGIGWAVEKDFDKMFAIWAHDERLYHHWLTSKSTTRGFAEFEAHAEAWRDPKFKGTTAEFRDLEITFSKSGDVAWYSCRLDDCYEYDGKPGCVENVLQTGVLEKRDGKWVHVLMHGSYPVDEIPIGLVKRYYGDSMAEPNSDADRTD